MVLSIHVSRLKLSTHLTPRVLHVPPISIYFIQLPEQYLVKSIRYEASH
jgi:hypothetical protein